MKQLLLILAQLIGKKKIIQSIAQNASNMKKIFILLIFFISCNTPPQTPPLNAEANFSGTSFTIRNNDTFDYLNAEVKLNDKYSVKGINIVAGRITTIDMRDFADDEGNRFSHNQKPLNIFIYIHLPNGEIASYYATWQ